MTKQEYEQRVPKVVGVFILSFIVSLPVYPIAVVGVGLIERIPNEAVYSLPLVAVALAGTIVAALLGMYYWGAFLFSQYATVR